MPYIDLSNTLQEGCDPTTVGIGDKCTISFKKNSRTKAELFSAKFLYEGDVDVSESMIL